MEASKIKKLQLPICPYCGQQAGYADVFVAKNKPSYKCRNCGKELSFLIRSALYKLFVFAQIVSISIFVVAFVLPSFWCKLGLALVFLIFVGFYTLSPFLIRFEKSAADKKSQQKRINTGQRGAKKVFSASDDIYSN